LRVDSGIDFPELFQKSRLAGLVRGQVNEVLRMNGAREGDEGEIRPLVVFLDFSALNVFTRFPSHVGEAVAIGKGGTAGEVLPEAAFEGEDVLGVDAEAGSLLESCA